MNGVAYGSYIKTIFGSGDPVVPGPEAAEEAVYPAINQSKSVILKMSLLRTNGDP